MLIRRNMLLTLRRSPLGLRGLKYLLTPDTSSAPASRSPLGLRELDSGMMSDDEMEFHEINQLMAKKYKYSYRRVRR